MPIERVYFGRAQVAGAPDDDGRRFSFILPFYDFWAMLRSRRGDAAHAYARLP